jgi:hypothetical protein
METLGGFGATPMRCQAAVVDGIKVPQWHIPIALVLRLCRGL